MKKFLLSFAIFLVAASLALGMNTAALAAEGENASAGQGRTETTSGQAQGAASENAGAAQSGTPIGDLQQIIGPSGLQDFSGRYHQLSSIEPGADIITSTIFTVIDFVKYLLGALTVIFLIVAGIKLINAGGKVDEVSEKTKTNIKYIIFGLILVIIADELVTRVFFGDYGECIASSANAEACAKVGGSLFKGLYSFILAITASIALFVIILSAFRLITSYGEEETINKQKKRITISVIALLIAGTAEFIVKGIIFREGGTKPIDIAEAQRFVYNFTNFIAAFIGAGAFAMLFYGGYMYAASFGNEEQTGKAKKIIISAIVGIIIALAAFAIVSTFTTFTSGREEVALPESLPGIPAGG